MCLSLVGRVTVVDVSSGTATVDVEGVSRRISASPLVLEGRPVLVGDWLLIHSGLAVDVLDEDVALELAAFIRSSLEDHP